MMIINPETKLPEIPYTAQVSVIGEDAVLPLPARFLPLVTHSIALASDINTLAYSALHLYGESAIVNLNEEGINEHYRIDGDVVEVAGRISANSLLEFSGRYEGRKMLSLPLDFVEPETIGSMQHGRVNFDLENRLVHHGCDTWEVPFCDDTSSVFLYLMKNKGRVVTRAEIQEQFGALDETTLYHAVPKIKRFLQKIGITEPSKVLATVNGRGYIAR